MAGCYMLLSKIESHALNYSKIQSRYYFIIFLYFNTCVIKVVQHWQVQGLKRELVNARKSRKEAHASLRTAVHKAAQMRLMEKEKNKSPSYAMRISLQINKVVWSMLLDGKSFAEVEINDMV
jgi:hypothetical protein